jgi:ABC-type dipeptide/oligopeptide/nickel transport system permease subunit
MYMSHLRSRVLLVVVSPTIGMEELIIALQTLCPNMTPKIIVEMTGNR